MDTYGRKYFKKSIKKYRLGGCVMGYAINIDQIDQSRLIKSAKKEVETENTGVCREGNH